MMVVSIHRYARVVALVVGGFASLLMAVFLLLLSVATMGAP